MTIKIYENDEIYVRPFVGADITERYLEWFQDQEVCKYNSHGKMSNKNSLTASNPDNTIVWAVCTEYDELIGKAVLNINWINRNAEFTCIFGEKDYWGEGYCTQVLKWIIKHGFNKLNLHKIWLGTAGSNIGMNKAAEKAGMHLQYILDQELFIEGQYQSINRWCVYND